jgi:hypothetical protein
VSLIVLSTLSLCASQKDLLSLKKITPTCQQTCVRVGGRFTPRNVGFSKATIFSLRDTGNYSSPRLSCKVRMALPYRLNKSD